MQNKKYTKRALLSSVIALILCCAMLLGTTFAWFTDSASTPVNTIQSGNLDIILEVGTPVDGKTVDELADPSNWTWKEVNENTKLFDEKALFEPGHIQTAALRVKNNGSLALKYNLSTNIAAETEGTNMAGNPFKLSNYLVAVTNTSLCYTKGYRSVLMGFADGSIINNGFVGALNQNVVTDGVLNPGQAQAMTLAIIMPTTVGNEANHMKDKAPSIQLGVNLVATQHASESDSIDNQYDANAEYPVLPDIVVAGTNDVAENKNALADAINNLADENEDGELVVALGAGTYQIPTAAQNKTLTITGTKDTVIDVQKTDTSAGGATILFEGVTILGQTSGNYAGFGNGAKVSYSNCVINGKISLYGDSATFTNCVFNNSNDYALWTWGAENLVLKDCVFNSGGKALLIYGEYRQADIDIIGCTFRDDGTLDTDKAAIEIGSDRETDTYNINIQNATVEGFFVNPAGISTGTTLWANKNSMPTDRLNVVVDGVDVY